MNGRAGVARRVGRKRLGQSLGRFLSRGSWGRWTKRAPLAVGSLGSALNPQLRVPAGAGVWAVCNLEGRRGCALARSRPASLSFPTACSCHGDDASGLARPGSMNGCNLSPSGGAGAEPALSEECLCPFAEARAWLWPKGGRYWGAGGKKKNKSRRGSFEWRRRLLKELAGGLVRRGSRQS